MLGFFLGLGCLAPQVFFHPSQSQDVYNASGEKGLVPQYPPGLRGALKSLLAPCGGNLMARPAGWRPPWGEGL